MITPERLIELWSDPATEALAYRVADVIDEGRDIDRAYAAMVAASASVILATAEKYGNVGVLLHAFLAGVQERTVDVAATEMVAGRMP
jgi:hypothetical protein